MEIHLEEFDFEGLRILKQRWFVAVFLKVGIPVVYPTEFGAYGSSVNMSSPEGRSDQLSLIRVELYLTLEKLLLHHVPESSFYFPSVIPEPEIRRRLY